MQLVVIPLSEHLILNRQREPIKKRSSSIDCMQKKKRQNPRTNMIISNRTLHTEAVTLSERTAATFKKGTAAGCNETLSKDPVSLRPGCPPLPVSWPYFPSSGRVTESNGG